MDEAKFFHDVAYRVGCDWRRAQEITETVFAELRDRLSAREAADVAAQLPSGLKRLWRLRDRPAGSPERTHLADFVKGVRDRIHVRDDAEAERAIRIVFGALQELLGSLDGLQGEAWDVFSQLPKDLKRLWLAAAS
jgi:uncharacterized protein (DUF2267 family)